MADFEMYMNGDESIKIPFANGTLTIHAGSKPAEKPVIEPKWDSGILLARVIDDRLVGIDDPTHSSHDR